MSKANGSRRDTCLIKCRVEPGMFKSEWLVFMDAIHPENRTMTRVQLFVDEREVTAIQGTPKRNQPAEAFLRASFIRAKGGLVQVVLPQPATPLGETVFVTRDLVDLGSST
jgi:hypothetical protein